MSRNVLLIISGSIAAYKSLDLIRRLRERGAQVNAILTSGGAQFITPLAVSSLTGTQTYTDLFSLKDEVEMGHIRLSREADLVLVAPASADLIAKMAAGRADDLASAVLLASNKPIYIAPAMNAQMWTNPATQANLKILAKRDVKVIHPTSGDLACGEVGTGRMAETETILAALGEATASPTVSLKGLRALVTAGPTVEPIDPVRFMSNYSSGKQGYAIAEALAQAGAEVTLVSGPTHIAPPKGVALVNITTAEDMWKACKQTLPVDIAVCAAAVADWRAESYSPRKMKKRRGKEELTLKLKRNPDILAELSQAALRRPKLVIGFAAETNEVGKHAKDKLTNKKCDWIVANDVSKPVFGEDENEVTLLAGRTTQKWKRMSKRAVAERLIQEIADYFSRAEKKGNPHVRRRKTA